MFWPLAHSTFGKEEIAAANRVMESGNTTMGVNVARFEAEFAKYHGMRYGVMVNSGSSANLVATTALVHRGGTYELGRYSVVVPAVSWITTYTPFYQNLIDLIVVDVDLDTLNMDVNKAKDALVNDDAVGIVAVSILGNPAPLPELQNLCADYSEERESFLFEDNCESLDAGFHNYPESGFRHTGTFGLLNTFSFFYSHHISTMEGGMILTNDKELYDLCRSIRNHGWTRGIYDEIAAAPNGFTPDEAYYFVLPGYNVRPLEICGAIGLEQLKKLPEMTRKRRKNWKLFQHLFKDSDRFIIQKENGTSSAFAFTLICRDTKDRPRVLEMLRRHEIGVRMITGGNFLRHPVAEKMGVTGHCPNADKVHDAGFFVGNHPYDLEKQIYRLKELLS